jgi:putative membrane protein
MSEKPTGESTEKRILILCVDRDGDLGTKAGIKTPLIGRQVNLDAAVALALKDPEEPDANAMFEAVSVYDRLQKEKKPEEVFEVSTICGSELGGVGADRKLVDELNSVLGAFSAKEVILVTDGYTDEAVLPLVESRVPVSSVRRIVVKHSESIEESAQLMGKYARMLIENPKYSRIALGVPGVLFVSWVICWAWGYANYYPIALLIILGVVLLVKGFGVDRQAKNFYQWAKEYSPPPLPMQIGNYATIAGILCVAVSAYSGYSSALSSISTVPVDTAGWISMLPSLSGYFINGAIDLIVVGLATILFGRALRMYFAHDARVLRNAALIVSVIWCRFIFTSAATVLIAPNNTDIVTSLVYNIIVGILIGIASVLIILIIHRSAKDFFTTSKSQIDEIGEIGENKTKPEK